MYIIQLLINNDFFIYYLMEEIMRVQNHSLRIGNLSSLPAIKFRRAYHKITLQKI